MLCCNLIDRRTCALADEEAIQVSRYLAEIGTAVCKIKTDHIKLPETLKTTAWWPGVVVNYTARQFKFKVRPNKVLSHLGGH